MTNRPIGTHPIPGHRLMHDGAAHDENGYQLDRHGNRFAGGYRISASGTGRALCECGVLSEPLTSRNKRADWHRQHKNDIRNQKGTP